MPRTSPTTSDPSPTSIVSNNSTRLTRPALMPSSRYVPNSRRRRRMRKRFAYTTKKPSTHATTTENNPIIIFSRSSMRTLSAESASKSTAWLRTALNA